MTYNLTLTAQQRQCLLAALRAEQGFIEESSEYDWESPEHLAAASKENEELQALLIDAPATSEVR